MELLDIKSTIKVVNMEELSETERVLVHHAIDSTAHSYAPYSHFKVGAAVYLENGEIITGCNQENVSYPAGICAERTAIYAAGAQYPTVPIVMIAIAARGTDGELQKVPISPCGICRQVMVETESRFHRPLHILLYGKEKIYIIEGVKELMPLSFTDF